MLQRNTQVESTSVPSSYSPEVQKTIAQNAMAVVYHLRMTGWLVTSCAELYHSPVFLVDVAHGSRDLSPEGVQRLSEVLGVSISFLEYSSGAYPKRTEYVQAYLVKQGRLREGVPIREEDELLMERFPEVVAKLNQDTVEREVEDDWYSDDD